MNARKMTVAFVVSLVVTAAWLSTVPAIAQEAPRKGNVEEPKPVPTQPPSELDKPGVAGGMVARPDYADVYQQIDATARRMDEALTRSRAMSKSFGELAALHQGADRSEILMMQRVCDSMGTMASETATCLQQYRKMLDDETATESGTVKAEVQGLKSMIDGMATQIENGLNLLHAMQANLGQG